MANTFAPNGFQQYQGGAGGAATFGMTRRRIASSYTTAIYAGDPVQPVVSTANGYIIIGSASTTILAGIFSSCQFLSTSAGRTVWRNYYPGSDATGDVLALVVDDPNARFVAQSSGTA